MNQKNPAQSHAVPPGMQQVFVPSPWPYYGVGGLWLLWAVMFPMYQLGHYLLLGALSAGLFVGLRALLPKKRVLIPIPYEPAYTGDAAADSMLKEGRMHLKRFRESDVRIEDEAVSAGIVRVCNSAQAVFDYIGDHPEKAKQVRRMVQYYMPTVQNLLDMYDKLEDQDVKGKSMNETMHAIAAMIEKVADAFDAQLDALFANEALNLTADMKVLEDMLKREGLASGASPMEGATQDNKDDEITLKL